MIDEIYFVSSAVDAIEKDRYVKIAKSLVNFEKKLCKKDNTHAK